MPGIVAFDVLAVMGELNARAVVDAVMQTRDEPFHHRARHQVQRAEPRDGFGGQHRQGRGRRRHGTYRGTVSTSTRLKVVTIAPLCATAAMR